MVIRAVVLSVSLALIPFQPPAPQLPICTTPEFAQFDFWVGEWEVFGPGGKKAGSNTITKTLDGCAIREEWRGAGGVRGGSFNVYHRSDQQWHQAWIDTSGLVLHLRGRFENGAMRMTDATNRITWTPNPDGTLRQFWEVAAGDGKSWKVAFDGLYKRTRSSQ